MLARRRGLTLVEVLIVISVVALLLAIGFPIVKAVQEGAKRNTCRQQLHGLALELREYYEQNRDYPLRLVSLRQEGFVQDDSLLRCPNDPRKGLSLDDLFWGYDLFYACRDASEFKDALAGGCAFHGGDRGLILFLDGTVEGAKFDRAKVVSTIRKVEVRPREKSEWLPARVGMELRSGDAIRTGRRGKARISFFGEASQIEVQKETLVVIKLLLRDPDTLGFRRLLAVVNGSIWCDVDDSVYARWGRGSSFEVVTPSVVAGVRGTRFFVRVTNEAFLGLDLDRDGLRRTISTYLYVAHGRVIAKWRGRRIRLTAGRKRVFEIKIEEREREPRVREEVFPMR